MTRKKKLALREQIHLVENGIDEGKVKPKLC
jgi:hypothetical protein